MVYYHVSRLLNEGQILTHKTKNNYQYCRYIEECDVSSCENLLKCCMHLRDRNVFNITGRRAEKWCCEALFEYIRKTKYPNMPSRIWGIFLSKEYGDACVFLNNYRKPTTDKNGNQLIGHIYEIDVPENKTVFVFDMSLYTEIDEFLQSCLKNNTMNENLYDCVCDKICEYWESHLSINYTKEYLIDCDLVVGRQVL